MTNHIIISIRNGFQYRQWCPLDHLLLRKQYPFKKTFRATLIANAFSYILGAVLIILLCI